MYFFTLANFICYQNNAARAERFELPSAVLETVILPLNYARVFKKMHSLIISDWECKFRYYILKNKTPFFRISAERGFDILITSQGFQLPDLHLRYGHLRG